MRIEKCVFGRGIGCSPQRHWPWPTYILFSHTLFTLTLCPILQRAMTLLWVFVPGASACKYLIGFQLPWKASPPSEPGWPPNFQVWELSLHARRFLQYSYETWLLGMYFKRTSHLFSDWWSPQAPALHRHGNSHPARGKTVHVCKIDSSVWPFLLEVIEFMAVS